MNLGRCIAASADLRVANRRALVDTGLVAEADLNLFEIVDDAEAGWNACVRRGLIAHTPPEDAPAGTSVL